jgi:hypothetical protein
MTIKQTNTFETPRWIAPAIPIIAVVLLYILYDASRRVSHIDQTLPFINMKLSSTPANAADSTTAISDQLAWGMSGLVYVVAWLVSVGVNFSAICRVSATASARSRWIFPALGVIAIAAGLWGAQGNAMTIGGDRQEAAGGTVFVLSHAFASLGMSHETLWLDGPTGLGIGTVLLLVVTVTALLRAETERGKNDVALHELRARCMRQCLYAGAAVLVTAVVHGGAIQMLPRAFMQADDREVLQAFARSFSQAQGTLWTLGLLAIFAPTALILHRRAMVLARRHVQRELEQASMCTATGAPNTHGDAPAAPSNERETKWLRDHGLGLSFGTQFSSLIAALAPFITGTALIDVLKLAGG